MIVGDLVTPHGRSPWLEIGLGVLLLGLMSVNYELSRRRPELARTFHAQQVEMIVGGHVAKGEWPAAGGHCRRTRKPKLSSSTATPVGGAFGGKSGEWC